MTSAKRLQRRWRSIRYALARRFFDTRYGRDLLINAIGPRVLTMTADCGDHILSFSPGDYIGKKVFRKGDFERQHVDILLAVLKERGLLDPNTVLLELGANIGTQTVYFSLARAYAHIVSVEPDPRNFQLLVTNIAQNGLSDRVTLVNCAAGESDGEIDFFQHRRNHGKSSALRQSPDDIRIRVPVRPVDTILDGAGIAPETIGLVWMDIEGYEPVACRSMQPLLQRRVPLYAEFSPVLYGPEQTAAFIRYLAGFYDHCIVFHDGQRRPCAVTKLATEGQYDVLFLP